MVFGRRYGGRRRYGGYRRMGGMRRRRYGGGRGRQAATNPYRYGGVRGRTFQPQSLELKTSDLLDTVWTNQIGVGSVPTLMTNISVGTDYTSRLGRVIMVHSLQLKGYISPVSNGAYDVKGGQSVRMLVFVDRQPNGLACAASDLLQAPSPANTTSMINLNNRNRFLVLTDKLYKIGPLSLGTSQGGYTGYIRIDYYKRVNIPVTFNGTGGTIGSIASNAIYCLFIGDNASSTSTNLQYTGAMRVRFTDS